MSTSALAASASTSPTMESSELSSHQSRYPSSTSENSGNSVQTNHSANSFITSYQDTVSGMYQIKTYFNYLNFDNYFLKASGKTREKKYGSSCIGCTFRIMKTDVSGTKHPVVQTQQASMSNTRLSLPYAMFGLSKINNYIENFYMGVDKNGTWNNFWTPIIPNSQLFVSPINNDCTKWKIEIFINPTKALYIIIASTIVVLILLGIIIMYYHRKEKIEDNPNDNGYGIF